MADTNIVVPSNPADLKKIKEVVEEIVNSMTRASAEKDYQKEAIDQLAEDFEINKKFIRRMASDKFKDSFEKKVSEMDDYTVLYEKVMNS